MHRWKLQFRSILKENKLKHQTIKVSIKHHKKEIYQLQNVNQTTQDIRNGMKDFNYFVEKYFRNYLNWDCLKSIIHKN